MVRSWQRTVKQKITQSFEQGKEITFPPLANSNGTEGPLVMEAEIQVAQKKVKKAFENADSSLRVELIPSKFKNLDVESLKEYAESTLRYKEEYSMKRSSNLMKTLYPNRNEQLKAFHTPHLLEGFPDTSDTHKATLAIPKDLQSSVRHHHRHCDPPLKYLRLIIFFNMLIRSSIIPASGLHSFVKKFTIRRIVSNVLVGETSGPVKLEEMRRFVLGDDLERMMAASDISFTTLYTILNEFCAPLIMDTGQGTSASPMQTCQDGEADFVGLRTSGDKILYWLESEKNSPTSDAISCPCIKIESGELGENSHIRRAGGYVLHTKLNEPSFEDNKYLVSYLSGYQSFAEGDSDRPVSNILIIILNVLLVILGPVREPLCLRFRHIRFEDDLFRRIISGSPVLETLVLCSCYGFEELDISNDSIKNFVISGYLSEMDTLQINAPHIESLTIKGDFDLKAILLLNMCSVFQAQLDYSNTKALYAMEIHEHHQMNEELFKGLILSLSHVKELKVGKSCLEVLASLKSKGFICPSNIKVLKEID
nr:hypothetical protein [Tanacetum cinerariifolium]